MEGPVCTVCANLAEQSAQLGCWKLPSRKQWFVPLKKQISLFRPQTAINLSMSSFFCLKLSLSCYGKKGPVLLSIVFDELRGNWICALVTALVRVTMTGWERSPEQRGPCQAGQDISWTVLHRSSSLFRSTCLFPLSSFGLFLYFYTVSIWCWSFRLHQAARRRACLQTTSLQAQVMS